MLKRYSRGLRKDLVLSVIGLVYVCACVCWGGGGLYIKGKVSVQLFLRFLPGLTFIKGVQLLITMHPDYCCEAPLSGKTIHISSKCL